MPAEFLGALVNFQPFSRHVHPRRGGVGRLAIRAVQFFQVSLFVSARTPTIGNSLDADFA